MDSWYILYVYSLGICIYINRALGNAELRVLVRTFFPWDACLSLGGSSAYACFFSRHALKMQELTDKLTRDQKPFDIIDRDTLFERGRRDYCPVSVDQSYDLDCSVAMLTGD